MKECTLCPRLCRVDRDGGKLGFCGQGSELRVARSSLHFYEEPVISGKRGSGTIFFSGCSLRCVFCQNKAISRSQDKGREVGVGELCEMMLSLKEEGAHNINLVTPTHFADKIAEALSKIKGELEIPVVYNTSGYERVETLEMLEGLVDIYMPDLKYFSSELSESYSSAPDYFEVASKAVLEMYRQVGKYELDGEGMMRRGLLVRHLVLPAYRKDSIEVFRRLAEILPPSEILVSVMSQYTPEFAIGCGHKNLERRVTQFEYSSVTDEVLRLGFDGFFQGRGSASSVYTPDFENKKEEAEK